MSKSSVIFIHEKCYAIRELVFTYFLPMCNSGILPDIRQFMDDGMVLRQQVV